MSGHSCRGQSRQLCVAGSLLVLLYGFWESNSGHRLTYNAPLPIEPPPQLCIFHLTQKLYCFL